MDNLCIIVAMTIYPQLTTTQIPKFQSAQRMCEKVADKAIDADVDPLMALAVAVEETRLRDITSPAGARGPLQVLPKYWCPKELPEGETCDYINAGLDALRHYMDKGASERDALRRYAGKGKRAREYAERVLRRYNTLVAFLTAIDGC